MASLAGKVIKYGGKIVVEAVEKGGKALLDVEKKVSSKLQEGVSFVASKTKSLVDKVGDLWNKGKTKVKNDFIEAGKEFRYAIKKLGEYVPKFGGGHSFATEAAGKIPSGGKNLLKDAYQYVKDTGEKVFGRGEKDVVKEGSIAKGKIDPLSNPKIAKEIEANSDAVYGYSPKQESPIDKFGIDWTNSEEVAFARTERIKYLRELEQKRNQLTNEVTKLQNEGMSIEEIAGMKVEKRNLDRIQSYLDSNNLEGLNAMKARNLQKYGREEGPTPEQLFKKYGSWEDVIYSSTKSSPAMDVLTGLYK
ncbi:hypothetical protein [Bacillus sp. XF8]|uniref:hypothetical protein n=1 Tax=Bacillus sp. XF8 TaxID=2819289 RepID=UPI001AA0952B|nr:hypothetical protein [Bacillus sp. XF8]MBO1580118.1 hypothetical protein [Bacillus sp. XF8]